jgi:hypothetical protein
VKGLFVDDQPDPVAGGVEVPLGTTGLPEDLTADPIDVASRHAGRDRGQPRELRLEDEVVDLALVIGRSAHHVTACHVGVIAVDECTDVDHHGVVLFDVPPVGAVVWSGRVDRAAGDDGVVTRTVGTETAHAVLELGADVDLGRPIREHGEHLAERRIGDRTRSFDAGQLGAVLRATDGREQIADVDQGEIGRQVDPPRMAQMARLRPDAVVAGQEHDHQLALGRVIAGGHDLDLAGQPRCRHLGECPLLVPAIGAEDGSIGEDRQPARGTGEAAAPPDVRPVGHEQRGRPVAGHQLGTEPSEPAVEPGALEVSAPMSCALLELVGDRSDRQFVAVDAEPDHGSRGHGCDDAGVPPRPRGRSGWRCAPRPPARSKAARASWIDHA